MLVDLVADLLDHHLRSLDFVLDDHRDRLHVVLIQRKDRELRKHSVFQGLLGLLQGLFVIIALDKLGEYVPRLGRVDLLPRLRLVPLLSHPKGVRARQWEAAV